MSALLITTIGLLAQVFFSSRILVQWIISERAKEVVSPSVFWLFSIAGSYLLCIYGWLRSDFAIILGQFISYYIYIWNLRVKGVWRELSFFIRIIIFLTPVIGLIYAFADYESLVNNMFFNDDIPTGLLLFGMTGQLLFTLRFIYQFIYSRRLEESVLPAGFWVLSILGSILILSYGVLRSDIVLIIGQSVGLIAYFRNLIILKNQKLYIENDNHFNE